MINVNVYGTGTSLLLSPSQKQQRAVNFTDLVPSDRTDVIRVLHVDDDPSILEISALMFKDFGGFKIDSVLCVDEALKRLETETYDVIVSDYEMPKKTGLEFLRLIKEQKNETPFILFTGKGREEVAIKALNLGADGYYNKLGSPETVYGELANGVQLVAERNLMKNQLIESEQKYLNAFENNPCTIVIFSKSSQKILEVNKAAEQLWGYSKNEIVGHTSLELNLWVVKSERERFYAILHDNKTVKDFEANYRTKFEEIKTVLISAAELDKGRGNRFQATIRDISERKKMEQEKQKNIEILEWVTEGVNAGLAVIGRDYNILWANKQLIELGVAPNNKCYQTFNYLFGLCPDCGVEKIFNENAQLDVREYCNINSAGEKSWFELRVTPLKDETGEVTAALELLVPITARKNVEEASRKTKEQIEFDRNRLETILEMLPSAVVIIEASDSKFSFTNKRARQLYGFDTLGINLAENVARVKARRADGTDYPIEEMPVSRTFKFGQEVRNEEMVIERPDGKKISILTSTSPLRDAQGNITAAIAIFEDITERKKTGEELKQNEFNYRLLANNTKDVIWTMDLEGHFTYVSPSVFQLRGYTPEEVISQTIQEALTSESAQIALEGFQRFRESGNIPSDLLELEQPRKDGSTIWTEVKFTIIKDENGEPKSILGVSRDISERRKIQKLFSESELKFRSMFSSMNEGVCFHEIIYDNSGKAVDYKILDANPAYEEILGVKIVDVVGKLSSELYGSGEAPYLKEYSKVVETGVPFSFETYFSPMDKYFLISVFRVDIGKFATVFSDISRQKRMVDDAKKEKNKVELLNRKLSIIGSLTRHDVANKLMTVKTNAYLLRKRVGDNVEAAKCLGGIDASINAANEIFEIGRSYELLGCQDLVKVDVGKSFDEAALLFQSLRGIEVINQCHGLIVTADLMLSRLLYNFISNSLKHGEKVTQIKFFFSKSSGFLRLYYEDNGVGISGENKAKLFLKGFTTGNGSGLGLKLIKDILEVYGWTITEEGKPGEGAKFVITIPSKPN